MSSQKVAVVTGASSGIGYATAIEFASRGYKTFACARRLEAMEKLKEYGITTFTLDVSSLDDVRKARDYLEKETGGRIDFLYNNAGQSCTFPALDVTDDQFKQCFEVNVFGPMRVTREFASLLIKAKGTVGFTGSVSGVVPFPFSCTYSATKAAIHQYAATLRLEMRPFDVKVLNFVTGGVGTNIADTRPLPADSWYMTPYSEEAMKERRQMAARNKPMPAEKYAYKVVNDFENARIGGPLNLYRGHLATFLGYLLNWCPRFIVENLLIRKFKLVRVFAAIREKYGKQKPE